MGMHKVNALPFVPGNERKNLLRVVMVERVGTLYRSLPDHAVVDDGRLQEVFVMKEENYENFEQYSITNCYLWTAVSVVCS